MTRRTLLAGISTLAASDALSAVTHPLAAHPTQIFVGGYTDQGSNGLGIYAYGWNAVSGELLPRGLAVATPNPSFLAVSPDRTTVYAANEIENYRGAKDGSVSSFLIDSEAGKLTLVNEVSSGGAAPCNINVDHTGRCVLVANYTGGSASSFLVETGGSLKGPVSNFHYPGHGPDAKRQDTAHAHCATASPDNGYVLINDLGLDLIHIYKLDPATAQLAPNSTAAYTAKPASGPRSLAFHPNGHFAFVTNELADTVDVLTWSRSNGMLNHVQTVPSLEEGHQGTTTLASVVLDRTGRFLYVSNRLAINSLVVFAVDAVGGHLTFVQRIASGGKTPRHFAIDPSGKWLIVAHQDSNELNIFARDPGTGKLTVTDRKYPIDKPTCVVFA